MAYPTLEEARELIGWQPPLGVLSVFLNFEAGDRRGAWRTKLRNGLDAVLDAADGAEHERRGALRATVGRVLERFGDEEHRPPPRGEVGLIEVAERGGTEHWWTSGMAAATPEPVSYGEWPALTPLIEVSHACRPHGIALVSSERVRLLRYDCGSLEEFEELELTVTSLDWRERKSSSTSNPARAQGVSSSGHDRYGERLEHNRRRFLEEAGGRAGERLAERGLGDVFSFGNPTDVESFASGLAPSRIEHEAGGRQDLVSVPKGELQQPVDDALRRHFAEREQALAERAIGEARGGSRGAVGLRETREALVEGRVEHLLFDLAIGDPGEDLVRSALAGGAAITPLRDGSAELLEPAEGVAAILRY